MTIRNKTITYAENDLGVHAVYAEAQTIEAELNGPAGLLATKTKIAGEIRAHEYNLDARLSTLRFDERNAAGDISATAFEAHLKLAIANDEAVAVLRRLISEAKLQLDLADDAIRERELAHRSRVARMNVLGGYLQYLASAKNSYTQARANATDWPY